MAITTATLQHPRWQECIESWVKLASVRNSTPFLWVQNKTLIEGYEAIYKESASIGYDIIAYIHDDCICHEPNWDQRILAQFRDPSVGIVGIAGGLGHGHPSMYSLPYEPVLLARQNFQSNLRDAEKHGTRFTGERDCVVLDGCALFVCRELLDKVGGWPLGTPIDYFCYDYWICCIAREHGYKIRLVGIDCEHLGGKSSGLNPKAGLDFEAAHKYIYERFRSVLPASLP